MDLASAVKKYEKWKLQEIYEQCLTKQEGGLVAAKKYRFPEYK